MKYHIRETPENQNEPAVVIQRCMQGEHFDKTELIDAIRRMSFSGFEHFCSRIRELQYFQDTNSGAWATDRLEELPLAFHKFFWKL